jgi:hypothetical protein
MIVAQLDKKFCAFCGTPEVHYHSHNSLTTGPYPETDEPSPCPAIQDSPAFKALKGSTTEVTAGSSREQTSELPINGSAQNIPGASVTSFRADVRRISVS